MRRSSIYEYLIRSWTPSKKNRTVRVRQVGAQEEHMSVGPVVEVCRILASYYSDRLTSDSRTRRATKRYGFLIVYCTIVCIDEGFINQADVEARVVDHHGEDEVVDGGCKCVQYVSPLISIY